VTSHRGRASSKNTSKKTSEKEHSSVKLRDKVVVVTGSGNGIGEACARRFSAEGAKVVVTDIEADSVARVAHELQTAGLAVDITDPVGVRRLVELARSAYGDIDVWFSNAGYSGPRQPGDLQEDDVWEKTWRLHVMAHVEAARAVLPAMVARGEGYLIQTASSVALSTQADKVTYAVTKHAALALGEWLAVHYRPKGVRVSCFCPGPMDTRMLRSNDFPADHPVMAIAWTPDQVADLLVKGIEEERFLIQTHPDLALGELAAKVADYDGWIARMSSRLPD
jgi:NAD(P)-dependent dehydrogenase (short-subunit alcohol dehydrogenase family)